MSRSSVTLVLAVCAVGLLLGASVAAQPATFVEAAASPGVPPAPPGTGGAVPPAPAKPAAITTFTDRATFDAAFPALPIEDFEEGNAPGGGFLTCDAPLGAAGSAACGFAAGEILPGIAFQDNPGPDVAALILLGAGTSLNPSQALISNTFADAFDVVFDPPVIAAGMDLHSTPAPGSGPPDVVAIQVFDGDGVLIGSYPTVDASGPGNFWGLSSDTPVGRISILSTNNRAEGVDNVAFATAVVEADLAIVKTGQEMAPGQVVFTLTATNNGPADATNVVVTDALPAGLFYLSDDCGGVNGPPWTWTVGNLANGASASCNLTMGAPAPGPVTNTATISGDETDSNAANGTSVATLVTTGAWGTTVPALGGAGVAALALLVAAGAALVLRRGFGS